MTMLEALPLVCIIAVVLILIWRVGRLEEQVRNLEHRKMDRQ